MPFLEFVEIHPVGTAVDGVVDSYSSHGAYVTIGDVRGYVPLRLLADPPPRSAREVLKLGDTVRLEVVSFAPTRCSIDLRPATIVAEAAPDCGAGDPDAGHGEAPRPRPLVHRAGGGGPPTRLTSPWPPTQVRRATPPSRPGDRSGRRRRWPPKRSPHRRRSRPRRDRAPGPPDAAAEVATPQPTQQPAKKSASSRTRAAHDATARLRGAEAPAKKSAAKKSAAKTAAAKTSPAKKAAAKKAPAKKAAGDVRRPAAGGARRHEIVVAGRQEGGTRRQEVVDDRRQEVLPHQEGAARPRRRRLPPSGGEHWRGSIGPDSGARNRARALDLLVEIGNGVGGSA